MITPMAGRIDRMVMNVPSRNSLRIVVLLISMTGWIGCSGARPILKRYEYSEIIMGVEGRIILLHQTYPKLPSDFLRG